MVGEEPAVRTAVAEAVVPAAAVQEVDIAGAPAEAGIGAAAADTEVAADTAGAGMEAAAVAPAAASIVAVRVAAHTGAVADYIAEEDPAAANTVAEPAVRRAKGGLGARTAAEAAPGTVEPVAGAVAPQARAGSRTGTPFSMVALRVHSGDRPN